MVTIDKNKCIKCGACVNDCVVKVIVKDHNDMPYMPQDSEKFCINCQHCLAICPSGALNCHGKTPEMCSTPDELPTPENMLSLLKMRRSIRRYRQESIEPEIMAKLKESLAWSPTGCNDHRLAFHIVENSEDMEFFRENTGKLLRFLIKTGILRIFYPKIKRYLSAILDGEDVIYRNAPHMIICSAPADAPCADADPWIALSYFDLYLQTFGLGSCWCGFALYALKYSPKLRARLKLPKNHKVKAVLLFGKPAVNYPRSTAPDNYLITQ